MNWFIISRNGHSIPNLLVLQFSDTSYLPLRRDPWTAQDYTSEKACRKCTYTNSPAAVDFIGRGNACKCAQMLVCIQLGKRHHPPASTQRGFISEMYANMHSSQRCSRSPLRGYIANPNKIRNKLTSGNNHVFHKTSWTCDVHMDLGWAWAGN